MATDITPTSESFTETSMKPAAGEAIDINFGQQIAANTGYNKLGDSNSNKPMAAWGLSSWSFSSSTTDTATITISTDKAEGIADTFTNASSYIVLISVTASGTLNRVLEQISIGYTSGSVFDVYLELDSAATATINFRWFAFGY